MSNTSEEILRIATERLSNKVSTIMLSINNTLSNPEFEIENPVDAIVRLIKELAEAETMLNHSKNLYTQCLAVRLKKMNENISSELTEESKNEE